ncbi:hypothetical protein GT044_34440, partial [Streptomyces sp. SID335]|nr:hypothetical protein [Streptomyces sp. SID335]
MRPDRSRAARAVRKESGVRPRIPRTLRGRATAAAVLTMVVALAIGGGWLYVILRGNLVDNAGARTELAARQAAADIAAGHGRPHGDLPEPDGGVDAVLVL